jgi:hypothetical protein
VAVYVTFLAASGRNVAAVARALLREREKGKSEQPRDDGSTSGLRCHCIVATFAE